MSLVAADINHLQLNGFQHTKLYYLTFLKSGNQAVPDVG